MSFVGGDLDRQRAQTCDAAKAWERGTGGEQALVEQVRALRKIEAEFERQMVVGRGKGWVQ